MNSKPKNNFTDSDSISRKNIDTYRETSDQSVKYKIEKKSLENDFDSDALEGWSNSTMGTSVMKSMDAKYKNHSFSFKLKVFSGFIIVGIILIVVNLFQKEDEIVVEKPKISKVESMVYEKTDLIIPEKIEIMNEIPQKDQIQIKTIQKDYQIKEENKSIIQEKENIKIDKLPVKEIEHTKIETIIFKNQSVAKEIYLEDMKLIDYRNYRSRPSIKTKQIDLNGTPASQEFQNTKEEEITNWKIIEIPYIEYLGKTMSIFSKGNLKKALSRFEIILISYPNDVNGNFYGGLCYFNLGEYDKAILTFENCLNSEFNNFNEEAEWYLAKSYLANGENDKAKILFKKIEKENGYYSKQASKY